MMKLLIKYGNIGLTTTSDHRVWYHLCLILLVRVGGYIVNLCDFYFYKLIGKLTAFFPASGVQLPESTTGQYHYRRVTFSSQVRSKVGNILDSSPPEDCGFTDQLKY